ncbi:phosphoribosylanthranilate isomerase [Thalassobaculum sp. OXR-137]|uniref:phosphoribosylanthranilate isomerase n=1 Tax=Thalassobaculum sp. OXR-137 TaxID=3100173 RepID=UPI002AC9E048|nr:phosphoribosylanthranilate isomerase [Thalassobaculum sp. OXR-137]WPZ36686.1 phosphoribosylanthranilate isomerase [Thalassobaculum sp. OXR-137]
MTRPPKKTAPLVKICGLNTLTVVDAAVDAGADMIGFMFYPRSRRAVTPDLAQALGEDVTGVTRVAIVVDATDAEIDAITATGVIDMLQVHGREDPARVAELKARTGLPVMKALRIATREDMLEADAFVDVADHLLFDAKAPKDMKGALPGGNGLTFDWSLLDGLRFDIPWMLSGGLTADNVAEAIRLTGAPGVDTSSGVEDKPGVKSPERIRAFLAAAKQSHLETAQ